MGVLRVFVLGLCLFSSWTVFGVAGPLDGGVSLRLSEDGQTFATGDRSGEVVWRELATGEPLARWESPGAVPVLVIELPSTGIVRWVLANGQVFRGTAPTLEPELETDGPALQRMLALRQSWLDHSPLVEGPQAAVGPVRAHIDSTGAVTWSGMAARAVVWVPPVPIVALGINPGGQSVLALAVDGRCFLLDATTGRLLGTL